MLNRKASCQGSVHVFHRRVFPYRRSTLLNPEYRRYFSFRRAKRTMKPGSERLPRYLSAAGVSPTYNCACFRQPIQSNFRRSVIHLVADVEEALRTPPVQFLYSSGKQSSGRTYPTYEESERGSHSVKRHKTVSQQSRRWFMGPHSIHHRRRVSDACAGCKISRRKVCKVKFLGTPSCPSKSTRNLSPYGIYRLTLFRGRHSTHTYLLQSWVVPFELLPCGLPNGVERSFYWSNCWGVTPCLIR
jgi:hypothetical protein